MKKWIWIVAVVAWVCGAEAGKIKSLEIDNIRDYSDKEKDERVLGVEIDFS